MFTWMILTSSAIVTTLVGLGAMVHGIVYKNKKRVIVGVIVPVVLWLILIILDHYDFMLPGDDWP